MEVIHMNKKVIALSLASAVAAASFGITALADEPINVLVNGSSVIFAEDDAAPFIENDHTLVPMRAIFEALGASVEWDAENKAVVSYDPVSDVSIILQIGSNKMFVGDKEVELETPAMIVNDRTVVPVRAIAEGMNSKVDWDGEARTVIVEKEIPQTDEAAEPVADDSANTVNE
jgi:hypothetical protein